EEFFFNDFSLRERVDTKFVEGGSLSGFAHGEIHCKADDKLLAVDIRPFDSDAMHLVRAHPPLALRLSSRLSLYSGHVASHGFDAHHIVIPETLARLQELALTQHGR